MRRHTTSTQTTGFTLIETMIAVTIITLSIAGPLTTASRALVSAQIARDQLTASYLAQEGLEYVRAMRDGAYLDNYYLHLDDGEDVSALAWADFTTGAGPRSITPCVDVLCTLDPTYPMGSSLAAYDGDAPLYLSGDIYTQQATGTVTPFTRTIRSTAITASEQEVTSTVSWSFHGTPYSIVLVTHLTPWQ